MVTSYGIFKLEASDAQHRSTTDLSKKTRGGPRDGLSQLTWFRIVLDECQCVKNWKSKVAVACTLYDSYRRWCLSGTPVQNSPTDLLSYYRFLRFRPFNSQKVVVDMVKEVAEGVEDGKENLIKRSFEAISLRRSKGRSSFSGFARYMDS